MPTFDEELLRAGPERQGRHAGAGQRPNRKPPRTSEGEWPDSGTLLFDCIVTSLDMFLEMMSAGLENEATMSSVELVLIRAAKILKMLGYFCRDLRGK